MSSLKAYIAGQYEAMTPRIEWICAYAVATQQHSNAVNYETLLKTRKQLVALEATILNPADMEDLYHEATNHLDYWEMMQRHLA